MCGIAGVYQQNGHKLNIDLVESIGKSMVHRGPDNFNFLELERVGLSHNRLSLLDLSAAANQPFRNENYALTYNGEIYNFKEIRARLEKEYGIRFKTASDTEVLFYSLIHDGIHRCLEQIKGMFAFAFYDKLKDELWLARDRLGIKPLYYYRHDNKFFWSSEIKALADVLNLTPDPVKTLFSINGIAEKSNEYTLFKDVFPVKPGSYLKVKAGSGKPQEHFYYDIFDEFDKDYYLELDRQGSAEVTAKFERLFAKSVQSMLVSDAPLGAFVSGGIDSSLISAFANEYYPDLKLFTANVLGKFSEFEDARALSEHLGTKLFDHKFEPEKMLSDWAEVTYFYECPIIVHTNAIPFSNVARLAREKQVKAVLTGEGADELFLGYPRLLANKFKPLAQLPVTAVKAFYKLVPKLESYLFPSKNQMPVEFLNQLVQNFDASRSDRELEEKLGFLSRKKRHEQYLTLRMLNSHLVTLLHRNDRMGMMASIEARFPFLDEEIVKFAINLPAKYKIAASFRFHDYKHPFLTDKWIVREIAKKRLPKRLWQKKKNGFPMLGYKYLKVDSGFFKNGWVSENLALTAGLREFLVETQDPYFVAKLAAIEVFGRIYGLGEDLEQVQRHVLSNAEMVY